MAETADPAGAFLISQTFMNPDWRAWFLTEPPYNPEIISYAIHDIAALRPIGQALLFREMLFNTTLVGKGDFGKSVKVASDVILEGLVTSSDINFRRDKLVNEFILKLQSLAGGKRLQPEAVDSLLNTTRLLVPIFTTIGGASMEIMQLMDAISDQYNPPESDKIRTEVERIGLLVHGSISVPESEASIEHGEVDLKRLRADVLEGYQTGLRETGIVKHYGYEENDVRAALAYWRRKGKIPSATSRKKK